MAKTCSHEKLHADLLHELREGRLNRLHEAERAFLRLVGLYEIQGRTVSPFPSPAYAPTEFADHPLAKGINKSLLKQAMENLLVSGDLVVDQHGSGQKARSHLAIPPKA